MCQSRKSKRTAALTGVALLSLTLGLFACRSQRAAPATPTMRVVAVAAAADLRFALDELLAAFRLEQPEIEVTVTYGSSGALFAQLEHRAPFDLFLAADVDYARRLVADGYAEESTAFEYARGHLVVWTLASSPLDLQKLGVRAVTEPSVRTVAIANPRHAPYGRAAEAALKNLGLENDVRNRLVLGENVAQAAQLVETGAADIGIIARSLARSPALRHKGNSVDVPADAHPPLVQGGVILSWARNRAAAEQLREFLLGPAGQRILDAYGFDRP